jgi:hypothetical protein
MNYDLFEDEDDREEKYENDRRRKEKKAKIERRVYEKKKINDKSSYRRCCCFRSFCFDRIGSCFCCCFCCRECRKECSRAVFWILTILFASFLLNALAYNAKSLGFSERDKWLIDLEDDFILWFSNRYNVKKI